MKKTKKAPTKIVIATGGTGGHIFPAQALSDSLIEHRITPILICDDRTTKFLQGSFTTIEKLYIKSENMSSSLFEKIVGIYKLIFSIFKVRTYLKKHRPNAVIGFGGYTTFPTLMAAISLKIPTIIHEQNSVLGRVNRYLLPFVNHLCISFPFTIGLKTKYKNKTTVTGNFVRREVLGLKSKKNHKDKLHILIIGGSQGAQILSEVVPDAIKSLDDTLQARLIVYQQARDNLVDSTNKSYQGFKGKVSIKPFFENMGDLLAKSDLLIGRAGASTISEIIATNKPSILIPYIFATDNHQYHNAAYLVNNDACMMITQKELSPSMLATKIRNLLFSPEALIAMQKNLKKLSQSNNIEKFISLVMKFKK